ncbi:carboxypeptidase-like regulatory domain-containing protein [Roseovarius sp. M141]|uniref:carboxypeptidase-like regulatory domain-containing protein n=1 Tax=Roseovarius sp. M141 TaxID=2583806 RepID=UPI0020CCB379|nr:carboxypeptidase-like regulatory domain-containing protein [Roseovarius sp. M141]MCQ0092525.1 carboxypeptidase regulatory-like domain-containing protein [Roseovarius sp. M141]
MTAAGRSGSDAGDANADGTRAAPSVITGRVLGPDGTPVIGAMVMVTGDSPRHQDIGQVTGPDGTYRYGALIPGRYTLLARAADGRSGTGQVTVNPGSQAVLDITVQEEDRQ